MQGRLIWGLAVFGFVGAGCPDDGTGAGGDTDGSTDTDPGTTSSSSATASASTSASTSGPPTEEPTTEPVTTGLSGTGGSSGSTSSGSDSSSGGCPVGSEDCPCDAGECDDGLECDGDDTCVPAPQCAEEDSEPNDDEDSAPDLGDLNDFNPTFVEVEGALDGAAAEDWFNYHCNDTGVSQFEMVFEIEADAEVRVCQYLDCDIENNPTLDCPEDAVADTSPDGRMGCCSADIDERVVDFDCSDNDNDDSAEVYIRVDMPAEDACVEYTLGVHC